MSAFDNKEFVRKLRAIRDNDNFVLGVLVNAETEEEREKIIYYIDNGKRVCVETVTMLASALSRARKDHENGIEDSKFDKYIR